MPRSSLQGARFRHSRPLDPDSKLPVNEHQAAKFLGVSVATMRRWRVNGKGPQFLKQGGWLVRYRIPDLEEFQAGNVRTSTSDPGAPS